MKNDSNQVRFLATISTEEMEQETYGITAKKKKQFVYMERTELEKQLKQHIYPLIESISDNSEDASGMRLNKVTVKVGASLEGNLFIASGNINSSIEIEFCKK